MVVLVDTDVVNPEASDLVFVAKTLQGVVKVSRYWKDQSIAHYRPFIYRLTSAVRQSLVLDFGLFRVDYYTRGVDQVYHAKICFERFAQRSWLKREHSRLPVVNNGVKLLRLTRPVWKVVFSIIG